VQISINVLNTWLNSHTVGLNQPR